MDHSQRKRKRCFHRVMSGIERWGLRNLRFITLTSAPYSPNDIQYSFRRLLAYLRRAGRVKAYVKCVEHTKSGLLHLHILYAGRYIPQICLSAAWEHIHGARVVHIEAAYGRKASAAAYLAKYMSKEELRGRGYSWSWGWCHVGLVRVWKWFKRRLRGWKPLSLSEILDLWTAHVRRVRLLEAFAGLRVGHLRVLTEAGRLLYDLGQSGVYEMPKTVPFTMS